MAKPLHPDTPWWASLTGILLTFFVTMFGVFYAMSAAGFKRVAATGTAAAATKPLGIMAFFTDTVTYIPHIMLLFGVLADMLTYQGVYSIPSLIGLLSIVLNFFMKFFWAGVSDVFVKLTDFFATKDGPAGPAEDIANAVANAVGMGPAKSPVGTLGPEGGPKPPVWTRGMAGVDLKGGAAGDFFQQYDGCTVQGMDWLRNPYAPQTLVFTATVFSYYIFDLIQNRGWTNATATIVLGGILFGAQAAVIGNCNQKADEPGRLTQIIASIAEGLLFGGTGYTVVQSYFPGRLPSTAVSPFPKKTPEDLTPAANGGFKDADGNPYVCLPNGQCYPDLSSTESRKAFADIAAANLGTGAPAVPEDCAASSTS